MFATVRPPSEGSAYIENVEPGRYLAKLVRFEDEGVSQFAKPGDPNPPHRIRWVFNLAHPDSNSPLMTDEAEPFELFAWSNSAVGAKSTARPWFEALLNRPLEIGEGGSQLANAVIGKVAWAMIDRVIDPGEQGETPRVKLKLLSLSPYVKGQKPGTAKAPPAAQKAPEPVGAAAGNDDLPF